MKRICTYKNAERMTLVFALFAVAYVFLTQNIQLSDLVVVGGFGAVLGARALVDLAIPTGIDGGKVFQFNLRSNLTPEQVIQKAAAAIGVVNEEIASLYGGMTYFTQSLYAYYRQGSATRNMTPKAHEYKDADPMKGQNIGHMLPLDDYDDEMAWTERYLRDAPEMQLDSDVVEVADRWRNRIDYEFWVRVLMNTENAIGSGGYDVGWVNATDGNVDYVPPAYMGKTFDTAHTHYIANTGTNAAAFATLLNSMSGHLREHGHRGMLTAFVSETDIDTYSGMTDFVKLNPQGVVITGGSTSAPVYSTPGEIQGMPGELLGYFNSKKGLVALRWYHRIPTKYAFMTKSYGTNNPRNGVAIRLHPAEGGFGLRVVPLVTREMQPKLDKVTFKGTHGIGTNERTNGVAGHVDSASWSNPSISE